MGVSGTDRYKLIRQFGDRLEPRAPEQRRLAAQALLIEAGWGTHPRPRGRALRPLMDPGEMRNLAERPEHAWLLEALDERLGTADRGGVGSALMDGMMLSE